jgi:DNA repair protein RadA/Sms
MAKTKTSFYCQNCGAQHSKWQGQCSSCKEWNTLVEEVVQIPDQKDWKPQATREVKRTAKPLKIAEIEYSKEPRLNTLNGELNRVLGGGIVPGSLTLIGVEPGIGKSTLLLQISLQLPHKTLYVSGEESQQQIKMRAERINPNPANCYILTETKTQNNFKQIEELQPEIVIIDSIHVELTEEIMKEIEEVQ